MVWKIIKSIGYTLVVALILLVAQCAYHEYSQSSGLESLCASVDIGQPVNVVLDNAGKIKYKARTGGSSDKNDKEWFDREYLRIGEWLKQSKNLQDDYSVVFAKPGIGYYACIVTHKNGLVISKWFEDRSS